jgi:two-component system sensor histidine kinase BaeS
MKSLFFRLMFIISLSLLIAGIVFSALFIVFFNYSVDSWTKGRQRLLEEEISFMLNSYFQTRQLNEAALKNELQKNVAGSFLFILYEQQKKPLFSLRKGKNSPEIEQVINKHYVALTNGYFFSVNTGNGMLEHIDEDFINSVFRLVLLSFLLAIIFCAMLIFFLIKQVTAETTKVAEIISSQTELSNDFSISGLKTKEIAEISGAVKIFIARLSKEKELRRQWTEDIAHDLRTPISAVKAQLEGLQDGVFTMTDERLLKNLRQIRIIEDLINDLGELSTLEAPEFILQKSLIKLKPFIDNLLARFGVQIQQKNLIVNNQLIDCLINADQKLLERALGNILENAFKYAEAKSEINIYNNSKSREFIIHNSGSYIKQEDLDKIFDRLFRSSDTKQIPGSGLGLTISKKIIELHQGKLTVKSSLKDGTAFTINLP